MWLDHTAYRGWDMWLTVFGRVGDRNGVSLLLARFRSHATLGIDTEGILGQAAGSAFKLQPIDILGAFRRRNSL